MSPKDFRAVNGLCLVDFDLLNLPVSQNDAMTILEQKGFRKIDKNIVDIARTVLGVPFKRNVNPRAAPKLFDCSSLTQWLYGQIGLELPRLPIQQWEMGESVELESVRPGDLIFASGRRRNRYSQDPKMNIGHVGLVSSTNTVIYAYWKGKTGVIEGAQDYFTSGEKFRGVRRMADLSRAVVLVLPPNRHVTTADDIKWVVLDNLRLIT